MATSSVTLSNGKSAKVGSLRYGAYKSLKTQVLDTLSEQVASVLQNDGEGGVTVDHAQLSALATKVGETVDELNEDFVRGCLDDPSVMDSVEELTLEDMDKLTDRALEHNPVERILEREKNSPAGTLVQHLLANVNQPSPAQESESQVDIGGSDLKHSSFDPGGPSES